MHLKHVFSLSRILFLAILISLSSCAAPRVVYTKDTKATWFGHNDVGYKKVVRTIKPKGKKKKGQKAPKPRKVTVTVKFMQDSGKGAPILNHLDSSCGYDTNNLVVKGVAVPEAILAKALGVREIPSRVSPALYAELYEEWKVVRDSAVRVSDGKTEIIVPIVDLGPGYGPQANGYHLDETKALHRMFPGKNRKFEILAGYYNTHPRPTTLRSAGSSPSRQQLIAQELKKKPLAKN